MMKYAVVDYFNSDIYANRLYPNFAIASTPRLKL